METKAIKANWAIRKPDNQGKVFFLNDLYAVPKTDPSVIRGQELVVKHSWKTCHRIHGEGAAIAPDLSFVADRRPEREWHLKHFRDPKSVSPGSFMPKFPVTDSELNDLTNYVLTLKGGT